MADKIYDSFGEAPADAWSQTDLERGIRAATRVLGLVGVDASRAAAVFRDRAAQQEARGLAPGQRERALILGLDVALHAGYAYEWEPLPWADVEAAWAACSATAEASSARSAEGARS